MWVGVRVLLLAACVLANENITVVRKTAFLGEELQLLVDNTIEYIVLFTVPPSAQRYEATRLRVNSGGGDITRPLLITARQLSGATTWQVPYFSGDTLLYEFERTLCPTDAANDTQPSDCAGNETQTLGEFTVHVGTSCVNSFLVHVTAEPVHDWKLQLDQPRPLEITLGAPSVYRYQFAEGEDSVRLVVESEDYVCAMVAVQNYTCPIAQTITEIEMSTLRMSVLRSGATQLSKTRYPNGFYVIVALTDTDTVCIGEEEDDDNWLKLWPEDKEPRVVGPARVKHITARMQPSLSRAQYAIGASVIVIIFTLFYMVFGALIIAERWDCWWRLVKPRAVLASPSVGSIGNLAELESMADMTSPTRRRRRDSTATFDSSDNSDTDESDETEMVQPSVSPTSRQTDPTTNVPDGTNPPTSPPTSPRTSLPTSLPTSPPTNQTTNVQTNLPTSLPTDQPTNVQTNQPTNLPTDQPTDVPTNLPTDQPTDVPTNLPTDVQTNLPTSLPTEQPTDVQTILPTSEVTATAVNGHGMISVIEVNGNRSNVEGVTVQTEQPARPFGLPARLHVAALARRRSRVLRARSDRYLYTLYTVAIFYSLPVVQFVAAFQVFLNVSGSLDLCYYNFLCAHPLGALSDFNHVFSNVGYLLLGALFMLQMRRRKMKRKREPRNEEYGIPPHYGLLSSLGASMMVVALLSASYHVCPNRLNFQFDTAFMYVLAVLSMVKIYQSRHPDINARAHATFGVLAVLIALVVWGVLGGGPLFWSLFTVVHVFTFLLLSLQIYYVGQFRLQKESLAETARSFRNNVSGKPVYVPRMLALVIANAVNWAFAIYGLISQASDIASHLLNILLGNTLLYMVFYITMKLLNGEKPRWYAWVYLASAFAAWGPALYFFVSGSTSWSQTPAHSRHLNHECKVLSFYDSHDLWHMLSAVALYFTFNAMLTWDDGLAAVKREDIAVF